MMARQPWQIPGRPTQALLESLSKPSRRPVSLLTLETAFAADPTEEKFNQLKAEKERIWAQGSNDAQQAR